VGVLDPLLDGRRITLRGVLVHRRAQRAEGRGRSQALATTVAPLWPSQTQDIRSTALTSAPGEIAHDIGGAEVAILGPLRVLVGSREASLSPLPLNPDLVSGVDEQAPEARYLLGWKPLLVRSIRAGDEVVIRGLLRRRQAVEGAEGYREAAARWVLGCRRRRDAVPSGAEVVAAYCGAPKLRPGVSRLATEALTTAFSFAAFWMAASSLSAITRIWW
jgi:hypothetical protein